MAEVVDAEDGFFLASVVGFDGDGDVFFFVGLDSGKRDGGLDRGYLVVAGPDCGDG